MALLRCRSASLYWAGSDIEIELVDPKKGGHYQITLSPDQKDELLHRPVAA